MSDSTIGIKVADGSYYPVIDVDYRGTKKLVLTTAKDNQERVQVDLYRGAGAALAAATYIDSLVIENIPPAAQGEPEIELLIGIDDNGQLMAEAFDESTGERQRFDTSLTSIRAQSPEDTFPLDEPLTELTLDEAPVLAAEEPASDLSLEESASAFAPEEQELEVPLEEPLEEAGLEEAGLEEPQGGDFEEAPITGQDYPVSDRDRREETVHRRGPNVLLLVAFVIIGLALVAAIAYFIYRAVSGPAVPPLPDTAAAAPAVTQPVPTPKPITPAPTPAPASTAQAPKPAPAAPAAKSVVYRIKRGDTLWDISSAYYRNPWLYPKIAKANSIPNPDLIFAGTRIVIPEN